MFCWLVYRELDYVSDCQPFLDFCREEVLLNVRPKARAGDKVRRESWGGGRGVKARLTINYYRGFVIVLLAKLSNY